MSVSRRDFTLLALAVGAASVAPTALTQEVPATPVAPAPPSPEAEARIALIFGRYGSRFTEAQKADIRRLVTGAQAGLDAMRAYPLDNSVEPATTFRVYRGNSRPTKVILHR